ncbi:CCA tRNA nucleotidyltransferase [Micavibrio aeruginosavorus]|uniref:CCA tRNA nucleotidyltransferase n=1 Tax=Micavibrio aeruginosavorus EPB TaxID=349215 RepID=M4VYZ8_9BACT|nr:CCA tRNA nucleotidyltransferase [Micavibrio aeruginosavorus]AGH98404.1 CCA tRNA nucleotidyltransferase [Micavibrio aeruginosavorus EPB]
MLNIERTIPPTAWMKDRAVQVVFHALTDTGAVDPQVLFVGGCVRNTLLGLPPGDMDLATVHKPESVIRRLEAQGVRVIPTGIDHGTVTAVVDGKPFEITTLRRDVETDGRRAVVAFTDDWREDAARRDFTINTLLADADGHIYDPTGKGLADLETRRIVFVGEADQRVAEDHLRILRFFRFYALYGAGTAPDADALAACRMGADKIGTLSRERITQEMVRILMVDHPADILGLMFENGVMRDFVHPDYQASALNALAKLQNIYVAPDLAARMVVAAHARMDWVDQFDKYIVFSNALRGDLILVLKILAVADSMKVHELIYRFGNRAAVQAHLVHHAMAGTEPNAADVDVLKNWRAPALPITGDDVMKAGVERGPDVGRILKTIEEWWIAEDFLPPESACRARVKEELQNL